LTTAYGTVIPLAGAHTLACQQAKMIRGLCPQFTGIRFILRAFIPPPFVPQRAVGLEILPFRSVGDWNRMANITTKRYAIRMMLCALFSTIYVGDWGIEEIVNRAKKESWLLNDHAPELNASV